MAGLQVEAKHAIRATSPFRVFALTHQAHDDTGACRRWRLAAFLLLCARRGERTGVAHVVPGGRDPAIGTLDVRDAELVDVAVEGIGDAAQMPSDAEGIGVEIVSWRHPNPTGGSTS
jgi:hypothetical protein